MPQYTAAKTERKCEISDLKKRIQLLKRADQAEREAKKIEESNEKNLIGQRVRVQNTHMNEWDQIAEIIAKMRHNRSYQIKLENGTESVQNQKYLKLETSMEIAAPTENQDPEEDSISLLPRRSVRIANQQKE